MRTARRTRLAGVTVRDRRGRGMRGPAYLSGPLTPTGVPAQHTAGDRFDNLVLAVMREIGSRHDLGLTEFAVEEVPLLPDDWSARAVPLASLVAPTPTTPARIVLFRRPIEHRAETPAELMALVLTVVVEQVAELLGIRPDEVHPDYQIDD